MGTKCRAKGPDVATRGRAVPVTVSEEPTMVKPSMAIALKKSGAETLDRGAD